MEENIEHEATSLIEENAYEAALDLIDDDEPLTCEWVS